MEAIIMEIHYNGKSIDSDVDSLDASYSDRFNNKLDSLEIVFSDSKRLWSKWQPKVGDDLRVIGSVDTGQMYIDEINARQDKILLKALPIKPEAKDSKTRSFEKISFEALATNLAKEIGLEPIFYQIPPITYGRIEQRNLNNLEFLLKWAMLEDLCIKVYDGRLIISDYDYLHNREIIKTITMVDYPDYQYKDKSAYRIRGHELYFGNLKASFTEGSGVLKHVFDVPFEDQVTGNRIAEKFTKNQNRGLKEFKVFGKLPELYAGCGIKVEDYFADGRVQLSEVITNIIDGTSSARGEFI